VVFDGKEPVESTTTDGETLDGLSAFALRYPFQRGMVSSTIPLTDEAMRKIRALPFPVKQLTPDTPLPITNLYHTPQTLGPDRLASVIGAWSMHPGNDLLVIDAGTCITYDFIDHLGRYHGGNISPGATMRLRAMHEQTARLPLVKREGDRPQVGYDTETALRTGALLGMKLEIEGYIRLFQQKYPHLLVFLTGGDARNLDISENFRIFADDFLVPRGLNEVISYLL